MREEMVKVLKMVEEGKITADQAAELIKAGNLDEEPGTASAPAGRGKWLKIRVYDLNSNKTKVNVSIPLALVSVGLKLGMKFGPHKEDLKGVDLNEIMQMIQSGVEGKLVDVVDDESGEKVEIYVE